MKSVQKWTNIKVSQGSWHLSESPCVGDKKGKDFPAKRVMWAME